MSNNTGKSVRDWVADLSRSHLSPMDLLPHSDFCEKCIDLVLNGEPKNVKQEVIASFHQLRQYLTTRRVDDIRVVVFGGGSGLSNIIGGDSRLGGWSREPFYGLKEIFPHTKSIVCVTDDGGSTGELIKDIPLIAIGDIRHVLLSSIQQRLLQKKYGLSYQEALTTVEAIASLFNMRLKGRFITYAKLIKILKRFSSSIPGNMAQQLFILADALCSDKRLSETLKRPHCLGNLFLVSSIYRQIEAQYTNIDLEQNNDIVSRAVEHGISAIARLIGADENAVSPCTTTPAQLRFSYSNGVEASGECKSGSSSRGYPVENVTVDFSDEVRIPRNIVHDIETADVIILAPGSLYSSIIPVFQVPGLSNAVRRNKKALKMLISNLWVQAGETDITIADPDRKFQVSDMIKAYERNIPGGTEGLFNHVLCLSLKEVPGSIIQNYALEGKMPIYLDKNVVRDQGFRPVECGIYSKKALAERGVIQHDPEILAKAVKTIFVANTICGPSKTENNVSLLLDKKTIAHPQSRKSHYPSKKYRILKKKIDCLSLSFFPEKKKEHSCEEIKRRLLEIIWKHQDISISHLEHVNGIILIEKSNWKREQKWDKVFSFYDPEDACIKIRADQCRNPRNLEVAVLIALGQSLLGNYARHKILEDLDAQGVPIGKIYRLHLRRDEDLQSFFSQQELQRYLHLARMNITPGDPYHFTRVINGGEGFTPPGVLMGLTYAWYLDNRLASHIEYKMSLMKINSSDLIPEQLKMMGRRTAIINFFREIVFSA